MSVTEMVYGTPIRLPGEFFINEEFPEDSQIFFEQFCEHIRKIRLTLSVHHNKLKVFTFKDLYSCLHVFVRVDAVKKPLDCSYEGPYQIVERISDKVFKLSIKEEQVTISTDRLKPAYQETIDSNIITQGTEATTQQTLRMYSSSKKTLKRVTFATTLRTSLRREYCSHS